MQYKVYPDDNVYQFYQDDVSRFGDTEHSHPSCFLVSVNGSHAVESLHYAVPVVGVADPVTLYIHRSLRTTSPPPTSNSTLIVYLFCIHQILAPLPPQYLKQLQHHQLVSGECFI